MKKKSGSKRKRLLKAVFNPRAWVDFDRIYSGQRYILKVCSTYLIPQEPKPAESFEAAKARLNLTEKDLLDKQKGLLRLSLIMVLMAFGLFVYAIYNLIAGSFWGTILSLIVMMLAQVLAFRYHFWYFQIKQRKLGCTVKQWFRQGLLGLKK